LENPKGRFWRTWEDNIRMDLRGIRRASVAQDRDQLRDLVKTEMNHRFP